MELSNYRNILITKHISELKLHISAGFNKVERADLILIETNNPNRFHIVKNRGGGKNYPITFNDSDLAKLYLVGNNA